jgi:hypothetical protein
MFSDGHIRRPPNAKMPEPRTFWSPQRQKGELENVLQGGLMSFGKSDHSAQVSTNKFILDQLCIYTSFSFPNFSVFSHFPSFPIISHHFPIIMIPFYVNEIGKFTKNKALTQKYNEELHRKPSNLKMEAAVVECIELIKQFLEIKITTFHSWRHLSRLCERAQIFNDFLRVLNENPTMLADISDHENDILLGIQKTFRMIDAIVDDVIKRKRVKGFTDALHFQAHLKEVSNINALITQYGESLNLLDEVDYTQIRADDLEVC